MDNYFLRILDSAQYKDLKATTSRPMWGISKQDMFSKQLHAHAQQDTAVSRYMFVSAYHVMTQ